MIGSADLIDALYYLKLEKNNEADKHQVTVNSAFTFVILDLTMTLMRSWRFGVNIYLLFL